MSNWKALTPMEQRTIRMYVAQWMATKEIALAENVSDSAIKHRLLAVAIKFGVGANRKDLFNLFYNAVEK